jgi:predicted SAM-dependent methyltransferase
MKRCYINLACGSIFLDNLEWINFDYTSEFKAVKINLLKRLPLKEETANLVYSSHFLEHIPYPKIIDFLTEILRVLKPLGVVRLVLPDLENMANSYVNLRKLGDNQKADFLVIEMIDQCVRKINGGQLGVFYTQLKHYQDQYKSMIEFIKERTGEDFTAYSSKQKLIYMPRKNFTSILTAIARRIERYWIKIVILALPSPFRDQNISLADIGENHCWVWDFYSLKKVLEAVGFQDVKRVSASISRIKDFPFHPLDLDDNNKPRKGSQSMYIEATKPKI